MNKLTVEINYENEQDLEDLISFLNDTFYEMYGYKIVKYPRKHSKIIRENT
jgi:hypothetical protein